MSRVCIAVSDIRRALSEINKQEAHWDFYHEQSAQARERFLQHLEFITGLEIITKAPETEAPQHIPKPTPERPLLDKGINIRTDRIRSLKYKAR